MSRLTAAELQVAADRARTYPPGNSRHWGFAPEFHGDAGTDNEGYIPDAARLLRARPELAAFG